MTRGKRHVLIIEADDVLRDQLSRVLTESGYSVSSAARPGLLGLDSSRTEPTVLVLAMDIAGHKGVDTLRSMQAAGEAVQAVFIASDVECPEIVEAMKLGALDVLVHPFDLRALLDAVERGLCADALHIQRHAHRLRLQALLDRLTPREMEVCRLLVSGHKPGEVATLLGTAAGTVKVHRARLLDKLEANSLAQIVEMLRLSGLVEMSLPALDAENPRPRRRAPRADATAPAERQALPSELPVD